MAMTPEAKVKKRAVAQLKEIGAYYFFPATGGFGRSGVADIVGCYLGIFFALECKAGKNTPTPLQEREIKKVNEAGGASWVVNEGNVETLALELWGAWRRINSERGD